MARQRRHASRRPTSSAPALDALGKASKRVLVDPGDGAASGSSTAWQAAGAAIVRAPILPLPKACKNAVEIEGIARRARPRRRRRQPLPRLARRAKRRAASSSEIDVVRALAGAAPETGALRDLSLRHHLRRRPERRHRALPRHRGDQPQARAAASSIWSIPAASISTAPPTSPAPSPSASRRAEMQRPLHPRAEGPHRARHARASRPARPARSSTPWRACALWQAGLDYDHGTGHGVGAYLSVHEGPQRISKPPNTVAAASPA